MAPNASMMLFLGANTARKEQQQPPLRRSPPGGIGFSFGGGIQQDGLSPPRTTTTTNPMEHSEEPFAPFLEPPCCPAPLNQVELQFTLLLPPSTSIAECQHCSPATTTPICIQTPNGQMAMLELSAANPSATFCARQSNECGHGKWQIRVGKEEEELALWLDGVGSLHFWVMPPQEEVEKENEKEEEDKENNTTTEMAMATNNWMGRRRPGNKRICGGRLLLRERQFLRVPTTGFCQRQGNRK